MFYVRMYVYIYSLLIVENNTFEKNYFLYMYVNVMGFDHNLVYHGFINKWGFHSNMQFC